VNALGNARGKRGFERRGRTAPVSVGKRRSKNELKSISGKKVGRIALVHRGRDEILKSAGFRKKLAHE